MFRRIIRNDIVKSPAVSFITFVFIAAAAALISLAALLTVHLTGAIDGLMVQAKTPHFLQMNSEKPDLTRLKQFADNQESVTDFQVLEFLNAEGSEIVIGANNLSESVQDNGLSIQSDSFDFLLSLDGEIIHPRDGELYVPIAYGRDGTAHLGDKAVILGKQFIVAGFLKDSQMNSLLASSKRFLISDHDYNEIRDLGSTEYLIEFRLKDLKDLGAFESAYISAGLEADGPTVTYPLFKMMNGVSDGLMIAVILLISALVVLIAFLCIRFTLLEKMEEEAREIGVMKAIGMRTSDLKKLYLGKYAVIGGAGCLLGSAVSLWFSGAALKNIRQTIGEGGNNLLAIGLGAAGILVIYCFILIFVNNVLRRIGKQSAVYAIRFGGAGETRGSLGRLSLSNQMFFSTNVFLGIKEVLWRKKLYVTMLFVIIASAFIILVPMNLHHTISSPEFSTYMGIGRSDFLIRIQNTPGEEEKEIIQRLKEDQEVAEYAVLTTKRFYARSASGSVEPLKIELGNHTTFPVQYVKGKPPEAEGEIALSVLNGNEWKKQVGDTLVLVEDGMEKQLVVSGIYSDITNGGKTAKASFEGAGEKSMWTTISVKLAPGVSISKKTGEYGESFGFAKISGIDEYILQTFGPTIRAVGKAASIGMVSALFMILLVTMLMMKLLLAKEKYSIAVMKSLGYTFKDLSVQYITRFLVILLLGVLLGTVLANTLGEAMAGALIASFGAAAFRFVIDPVSAYLIMPLLMGSTVLMATLLGTSGIRSIQISQHIKE
ncbi:ABC transporter permease [Lacrimispora aerotolerans]|uniref:ABC transporter permease n=1 Tax=Lacrimispora aerotolerans TaxID=36832 RepID=UPI00047AC7A9|nr:FtsX-like permease family protein [Lacrimispora aerotolerans]